MPTRYEARVLLKAPADEVRRKMAAGWGRIEPLGEKSCEYRTGDDDLDWLALRIAMLGVEFEVREPHELAAHLAALGEPPLAGGYSGCSCQGVRMRGPSAVTATVNSKWAASESSSE